MGSSILIRTIPAIGQGGDIISGKDLGVSNLAQGRFTVLANVPATAWRPEVYNWALLTTCQLPSAADLEKSVVTIRSVR